jgi:hypothetical protein
MIEQWMGDATGRLDPIGAYCSLGGKRHQPPIPVLFIAASQFVKIPRGG